MDITNISVSRKSVWDQCTQLYKYKYHLKLPSPVEEPFYFTYGKIIHKISEEFVKEKGKIPLGKMALKVIEGHIPINFNERHEPIYAPPIPKEYMERLPEHIKSIAKITKQIGTEGIVEYEFMYDLDPPNKRCVRGFIDRIVQRGDNFIVLDYKTSKKGMFRKTRGNVSSDLQLRTYARVVQKKFSVPSKNIMAVLCYLEGSEIIGARFSESSLIKAEEELLSTYKQIESTPADKAWGNVGDWCDRCEYSKQCPFRKMS